MKLKNKTVVITGASLRIGKAVALDLASRGARVVIHYRRSAAEARALQKAIVRSGGEAFLVRADFAGKPTLGTARKFLKDAGRFSGRIDVLINNASVFYPTPLVKLTERQWDEILRVNLKAPFLLSKLAGEAMKKQKSGKIINLVDCSIHRPNPDYLPYAISKAGLQAATLGLARALAPYVQVNSIAPGPILAPRGMKPAARRAVAAKTLLKRFGDPADIAAAVRFLTEGTDYVTGALLPVDGGASVV